MKQFKILFLAFIIILLSFNHIKAQLHPDYKFEKHKDKEKTFVGETSMDILQDYLGYIWFATNPSGLIKFDGNKHTIYASVPEDSTSMQALYACYLFEDKENTLWIGTTNGLLKYNRESDNFMKFYPEPDSLGVPNKFYNLIGSIHEDVNNNLWLTSYENLLYVFNK